MDVDAVTTDITAAEVNAMNGPIICGEILALVLYGALLNSFLSFTQSPSWARSTKLTRTVVCAVIFLCTCSCALYGQDLYFFGTTAVKTRKMVEGGSVWSSLELVLLAVVSTIVQSTLVLRSSTIINDARWKWAYISSFGLLILLELFGAAASCTYEIRYAYIQDDDYYIGISWTNAVLVWLWVSAGIDVLISASYIFNLTRRLGGVASTVGATQVLHLIVRLVVQSAAFTAVLAIAAASVTAAYPGFSLMTEDLFYAFWIPLPLLYALSLFTTLSIREKVTTTLGNSSGQGFSVPKAARRGSHAQSRTAIHSGVVIQIDQAVLSERMEEPELRSGSLLASEKSRGDLWQ